MHEDSYFRVRRKKSISYERGRRFKKVRTAEFNWNIRTSLHGLRSVTFAGKYIGFVGIAFAFGLSVLAMVYAIGCISGCHINPAISISMFASGKMKTKDTAAYVVVQCVRGRPCSSAHLRHSSWKPRIQSCCERIGSEWIRRFIPRWILDGFSIHS